MNFRGPDHSDYLTIEDKLILGHNRLAILDLDPRSNQPFNYQHLVIVFNGEIYNHLEIKKELIAKGYSFQTTSDTEVICAAYMEYGNKCLANFNGMFAFVIYDGHNRKLFGARDRAGKKPLYYTLAGDEFEFASQVSVIAMGNSFQLSELSINKYLLRGYVEDPYSIYEGIHKLKAGHAFQYDLDKKTFKEYCYWDIVLPPQKLKINYEDAKHYLKKLLEDAVKIRMISDVPLGTFLSGGIDSSLVTAIAASHASGKVNAFSVKFFQQGFDESKYASVIADHLGINHTIVPCNYDEGIEVIKEINYYYDEPFADSSAVPSILLARHTRKYMTVALTGDGGDEIFLGYARYKWLKMGTFMFTLPRAMRNALGILLAKSNNYRHHVIAQFIQKRNLNDIITDSLVSLYPQIMLIEPNRSTQYDYVLNDNGSQDLQRFSDLDFKLYLNNDCLLKVDRATMAASMEARCPLLDYRIIEFGRSIPVSFRYRGGVQKKILKDILYEYIPPKLLNRPKTGFTMPFKEWFKTKLKDYVYDTLSEQNLRIVPNLNVPFVKMSIEKHMKSEINFYPEIWKLIVLTNWLKGISERNKGYTDIEPIAKY